MLVHILFIVGVLLTFVGVAGCFLPVLPGPPLCFLALLIQQLSDNDPFSTGFLMLWAGIMIVVTALDYAIPLLMTKMVGGTRFGLWGCMIGLVFGFWFGPIGIIIGPLIGAFLGELAAKRNVGSAFRSAAGSLGGFLTGTILKLTVCIVMGGYLIQYGFSL